MQLHKIVMSLIVIVSMWLSAGCEKKPELKFSCYIGTFSDLDLYEPCATAEEERMSRVRAIDRRLDRSYLPAGVSENSTLIGYSISTRGHVFSISFLQDKEYKIEERDRVYTVTGPVRYKLSPSYKDVCPDPNASLDSPCHGAPVMYGSDVRNGVLTFMGKPSSLKPRAQAQR